MGHQQTTVDDTIFERLAVRPVINCCGVYTDLGGSVLSPGVWAAMEEVNRSYVGMVELLERTGSVLARLVGAEAARVTPGASAAIALGTAACITGTDGEASERLPVTAGLKSKVILQRRHAYKYDRCVSLAGGRLVLVGDDRGTTLEMIDAAIDSDTAMILAPAHLDGADGTVPFEQVAALARRRDVPTFVDAAYMNYPTSLMSTFTAAGAALVCFSAKYFGGPNAGGFICGRRDLVDAVAAVDFTQYESGRYRKFGRAFKMDRHMVVGVVVALQEWMAMDHDARWAGYLRKVETIKAYVDGIAGIRAEPGYFTMDERLLGEPVNCLILGFDAGPTAENVAAVLASGVPSIRTVLMDGLVVIAVDTLLDGQELVVGKRLAAALTGCVAVR
jgi:D-glucosaminate-6-phosphate ammonia-lyase